MSKHVVAEVSCARETDAAILVNHCEGGRMVSAWIPKSQIHDDSEVWRSGQEGRLIVTRWIADQKDNIEWEEYEP